MGATATWRRTAFPGGLSKSRPAAQPGPSALRAPLPSPSPGAARGRGRKIDIKRSPVAFFDLHRGVLAVVRGARTLEAGGKESVDGVDSYRLHGKVRARDASRLLAVSTTSDRLVDVDLWVGAKDML